MRATTGSNRVARPAPRAVGGAGGSLDRTLTHQLRFRPPLASVRHTVVGLVGRKSAFKAAVSRHSVGSYSTTLAAFEVREGQISGEGSSAPKSG
jgi:hypothetical protein